MSSLFCKNCHADFARTELQCGGCAADYYPHAMAICEDFMTALAQRDEARAQLAALTWLAKRWGDCDVAAKEWALTGVIVASQTSYAAQTVLRIMRLVGQISDGK